jgi:hypothetical protein
VRVRRGLDGGLILLENNPALVCWRRICSAVSSVRIDDKQPRIGSNIHFQSSLRSFLVGSPVNSVLLAFVGVLMTGVLLGSSAGNGDRVHSKRL